MTVFALIPARGGSKRLPDKNLKRLGGLSLVARAVICARSAGLEPIVSTDSVRIAAEAAKWGVDIIARPGVFATDDASMVSVAIHALEWFTARNGRDPDYLALLQPTSPYRSRDLILSGIGAGDAVVSGDGQPSGALYVIRPEILRRSRTFTPPGTVWLPHFGTSAMDIDTPADFARAAMIPDAETWNFIHS